MTLKAAVQTTADVRRERLAVASSAVVLLVFAGVLMFSAVQILELVTAALRMGCALAPDACDKWRF